MTGQRIGYIRVSSEDQNTDRQLDGIQVDEMFTDKVSGKSLERPALQDMMRYARNGDHLFVHSMDRLARNLIDLRKLVQDLTSRGVEVSFIKENLTFTGKDEPISMLLLNVIGAVAEFERSIIRERQAEGIRIAKAKGVYRGRNAAMTHDQAEEAKRLAGAGVPKARIARDLKVSRETLYKYLRVVEKNHVISPNSQSVD